MCWYIPISYAFFPLSSWYIPINHAILIFRPWYIPIKQAFFSFYRLVYTYWLCGFALFVFSAGGWGHLTQNQIYRNPHTTGATYTVLKVSWIHTGSLTTAYSTSRYTFV